MTIDVHLLTSFLALYDQGTVTAAAHSLGLQQPTLSLHLRSLREIFDDPLFVRHGGKMLPTPRAQAMVAPCRDIVERLAQLSDPAPGFNAGQSVRRFRIAMTDASQVTLLPAILSHVAVHAKNVSILVELLDRDLASRMAAGRIDLALGYIPDLDAGCRQKALYSQTWVCLTNSAFGAVDLDRYRYSDHVTVASGTGTHLLESALSDAHIERRIKLTLPGFLGLAAIIAKENYIATVPRHTANTLAQIYTGLKLWELPFPSQGFRVCQYWHTRFDRDPPNLWLRNLCSDLFAGAGSRFDEGVA